MCGSPPPHHFILGSVSTYKCNDFSEIKTFMPPTHHFILGLVSTLKCNDFSALKTFMPPPDHFILGLVSTLKCNDFSEIKTFMPPTDHFILGLVSTLKCDDLSVLKHLCGGPLHHSTLSWVQFHNLNVMTFLHLNIYAWLPFITSLYPGFSFNIQV